MTRSILLDTQLMVFLAVGLTLAGIIAKHKNLTEFTSDDFDLLVHLLGHDCRLILLPNTVSEAANLLRHHKNPERRAIMETFRSLIAGNREYYIESAIVAARDEYHRLGITDSAILQCGSPDREILTADAGLYVAAMQLGMHATNFNHKREEFGLV
ncbi:hypothetical protein MKL09_31090 [Methylobacterium sp. J-048]|uniref:PIN domain-containing protein n=1 Tax=Methylobacterium sp. J-048 TaxID=2836635 RepID=UPI001FB8ECA0|nr:PIN domain-containing protein [Methylobacterium sp. J-048]MCJ2060953.1 hypothetical protein [Methylobacterium sp. J-048]